MEWVIAVVVVVALGIAAAAAAGGMGEMAREPVRDTYRQPLPAHPITAHDLDTVRFGITLRGYAMGQVDDLLDRVAAEVAERDGLIAELTGVDPLEALAHRRRVAESPVAGSRVAEAPAVEAPTAEAPTAEAPTAEASAAEASAAEASATGSSAAEPPVAGPSSASGSSSASGPS